MKHINDKAEAIFRTLTEGLRKIGDHRKWNNNESFMPVSVEIIGRSGLGLLISIAHWYEQSGDLLRDPDVVFSDRRRPACLSDQLQTGQPGYQPGSGLCGRWRLEGPAEDAGRHNQVLQHVDAKSQGATTTGVK